MNFLSATKSDLLQYSTNWFSHNQTHRNEEGHSFSSSSTQHSMDPTEIAASDSTNSNVVIGEIQSLTNVFDILCVVLD